MILAQILELDCSNDACSYTLLPRGPCHRGGSEVVKIVLIVFTSEKTLVLKIKLSTIAPTLTNIFSELHLNLPKIQVA